MMIEQRWDQETSLEANLKVSLTKRAEALASVLDLATDLKDQAALCPMQNTCGLHTRSKRERDNNETTHSTQCNNKNTVQGPQFSLFVSFFLRFRLFVSSFVCLFACLLVS